MQVKSPSGTYHVRVTPEERKAKRAEYMRKWRAANPERTREIARESMARWRAEHPEESRDYFQKWRDEHPESVEATYQRSLERRRHLRATDETWRLEENARMRKLFGKWKGIPESALQAQFQAENPAAISMDRIRPDFYIPGDGFIEIKRALPHRAYNWRETSEHFPGLYFQYGGAAKVRARIDAQFAAEPRPLTVIIFHALTGEEITRKLLT